MDFFSLWAVSCLSVPRLLHLPFLSLPSRTEAWVVLRPHPICHKPQEYIRRGDTVARASTRPDPRKPSSGLRLPDHATAILPPPLADLVVRDSKLCPAPTRAWWTTGQGGLTPHFLFVLFSQQDPRPRRAWAGSGRHPSLVSRGPNTDLSALLSLGLSFYLYFFLVPRPSLGAAHRRRRSTLTPGYQNYRRSVIYLFRFMDAQLAARRLATPGPLLV